MKTYRDNNVMLCNKIMCGMELFCTKLTNHAEMKLLFWKRNFHLTELLIQEMRVNNKCILFLQCSLFLDKYRLWSQTISSKVDSNYNYCDSVDYDLLRNERKNVLENIHEITTKGETNTYTTTHNLLKRDSRETLKMGFNIQIQKKKLI